MKNTLWLGYHVEKEPATVDFRLTIELSKSWQTENGLIVRGTGNVLTAAYSENNINTERYLLKVYPLGALEFKYPFFRGRNNKSEVLIPVAQVVYSTDTSSPKRPIDEDSSTTEFDSTTLFKLKKYQVLIGKKMVLG